MSETLSLADADHAMRNWSFRDQGRIKIGSDAHRRMFCEMLLATHNPYKPAVIDWPQLSEEALRRITSLPIWDIAVQIEGYASIHVSTYAGTITEPLLRRALTMDGDEEARHKIVLSKLVEAYGIKLKPEPPYPPPKDPERAWMMTGYSECIDSFFSFGLFEAARQTGFFPPELIETFEPVIQEEARHILFYANWVAWYRRNLPWWRRIAFNIKVATVWVALIRERMNIAGDLGADEAVQDANFVATAGDAVVGGISLGRLIDLCLAENAKRMSGYDSRLLRPTLVPRLAKLVRRFVK